MHTNQQRVYISNDHISCLIRKRELVFKEIEHTFFFSLDSLLDCTMIHRIHIDFSILSILLFLVCFIHIWFDASSIDIRFQTSVSLSLLLHLSKKNSTIHEYCLVSNIYLIFKSMIRHVKYLFTPNLLSMSSISRHQKCYFDSFHFSVFQLTYSVDSFSINSNSFFVIQRSINDDLIDNSLTVINKMKAFELGDRCFKLFLAYEWTQTKLIACLIVVHPFI